METETPAKPQEILKEKPKKEVSHEIMEKRLAFAKDIEEKVERMANEEMKEERPKSAEVRSDASRLVTDLQYPMDGYLLSNLDEVPRFLKKSWDCVIIVSGNAKVRIGKSTFAIQAAYYIAWLLNEIKKKKKEVPQDNPVPFDNSNVAYDPDQLMNAADKKPKNSVLVYDEGRAGLDSARAMENINKAMQDFFQECGQYGHVIIIVLPDFFKLNETIAVPRSLFLLNVYTNQNYNRGYFEFFNEHRKELLYIIGKKRWGSTAKYLAVDSNFHGKFSDYFPINKEVYDENKKKALRKRRKTSLEVRWHKERDVCFYLLRKIASLTEEDIAKQVKQFTNIPICAEVVRLSIKNVERKMEKGYFADEGEETPKI